MAKRPWFAEAAKVVRNVAVRVETPFCVVRVAQDRTLAFAVVVIARGAQDGVIAGAMAAYSTSTMGTITAIVRGYVVAQS